MAKVRKRLRLLFVGKGRSGRRECVANLVTFGSQPVVDSIEGRSIPAELEFGNRARRQHLLKLRGEVHRRRRRAPRLQQVAPHFAVDETVNPIQSRDQRSVIAHTVVDAEEKAVFVPGQRLTAAELVDIRIARRRGSERIGLDHGPEGRLCRQRLRPERAARDQRRTIVRGVELLPEPFVGAEEEGPAAHDRAADREAVLVQAKRRLVGQGVEDASLIQRLVAKILERAAVKLVAAALRHDIHLRARARARIGGEVGRAHPEFGDGLGGHHQSKGRFGSGILDPGRVDAVEGPVVVVSGAAEEPNVVLSALAGVGCPRGKGHHRRPVPAVERDGFDLRAGDGRPDLGRLGIHRRGLRDHRDLARDRAHRQRDVERSDLTDLQADVIVNDGLKGVFRDGQQVGSVLKARQPILPGIVGAGLPGESRRSSHGLDGRIADHGAGGVDDTAGECRAIDLGRRETWNEHEQHQQRRDMVSHGLHLRDGMWRCCSDLVTTKLTVCHRKARVDR